MMERNLTSNKATKCWQKSPFGGFRGLLILLSLCFATPVFAQQLAKFNVKISDERIDAPVSVSLDEINYNTDKGSLALYEITPAGEKPITCQVENGYSARLWFVLSGTSTTKTERKFVLKLEPKTAVSAAGVLLKKDTKDLSLVLNEKPILSYRFATAYPPDSINPLYKRSGYIHPLYSPGGEVLTRIQAPDHYHHYGIWGPWTKTRIGKREVDFWNLALGQGTVRFAGFISEIQGSIFSGFKALQEHVDFGAIGEDKVAMNEILDVRAWNTGSDKKIRIVDYTTSLNCPLDSGIMLDAYRYGGGIGFRATGKWHDNNSTVLTSDNKTRANADGSFARWCIVEGESATPEGRSGILFLSHPSNRAHPEPMRVWPSGMNGRGDLYFEFVPIRHEEWKLEQYQNYTLKYRMIIFDGKMDAKTAEMYWNSFAKNPAISINQ